MFLVFESSVTTLAGRELWLVREADAEEEALGAEALLGGNRSPEPLILLRVLAFALVLDL